MDVTSSAEFRKFWGVLVSAARARGVPQEAAEDLCGDAILRGLESFDGERGDFRGFCHVILGNKVKNYWRTCRRLVGLEEEPVDPAGHPFEREEEMRSMRESIRGLILNLGPDEAEFLRTLLQVAEETDDTCVSEAARRLDLTPAKGWDLFRKIRRRAAMTVEPPASLSRQPRRREGFAAMEESLSYGDVQFSMRPVLDMPGEGFEAFIARIGPERVREITSLLLREES